MTSTTNRTTETQRLNKEPTLSTDQTTWALKIFWCGVFCVLPVLGYITYQLKRMRLLTIFRFSNSQPITNVTRNLFNYFKFQLLSFLTVYIKWIARMKSQQLIKLFTLKLNSNPMVSVTFKQFRASWNWWFFVSLALNISLSCRVCANNGVIYSLLRTKISERLSEVFWNFFLSTFGPKVSQKLKLNGFCSFLTGDKCYNIDLK